MADNSGSGFGKDPVTPSHGDSLVDQSFQSLKSKEVRDSSHDMKFHALSLNQPNSTGWDVQTSSEVTPDGRAFRTETTAKTDGVERINGGVAEFRGRNEQQSSGSHEGDDKNYVKKAAESSNTHLQETFVTGDENSGRTEMRTSSKTSSSSQKVVSSSSSTYQDDDNKYLMDTDNSTKSLQSQYEQQQREQQRIQQEHLRTQQQQQYQQHQQHQEELQTRKSDHRQYEQSTEEYRRNQQETNTSTSVETDRTHEENKRYIDMDKASPEYQQRVKFLMAQPGEIISNIVEYPKPNVKMITTVKRLPDGTIVKNKRYETEELRPATESTRQRQVSTSNQSNTQNTSKTERHVSDQDNIHSRLRNTRDRQISPSRSHDRNVDNVETRRQTKNRDVESPGKTPESQLDRYTSDASNVATFSSVKKSSRRFSTETTSETIEEVDDRSSPLKSPNRSKDETKAFTTHGFPSVRANKPTREYPTDRPQSAREDYHDVVHAEPRRTAPNRSPAPSDRDDVVIVKSERSQSLKQKTNSERVVETELVDDHYHHHPQSDFSTHGFPSVKSSSPLREGAPRTNSPRSPQHSHPGDDFSTHGFPSVKESSPYREGSPRTFRPSSPYRSQPREDFTTHGFPSVKESSPYRDDSPRSNTQPSSSRPRSHPNEDFSTHGFPSARSPKGSSQTEPDAVTRRIPIVQEKPFSSKSPRKPEESTSNTTTIKHHSTTESNVRKEKEVDAAHRAFAASLRSSSPVDSTYSDHQRSTPRSSITSHKTTTRRDTREGSHDSVTPSETSRISTSTITRQSPSGKPTTGPHVTKQTTTKTTETIDTTPQRFSKSPSPAKTTTTTTTTTTKKTTVDVPKPDNQLNKPAASQFPPINEPLTITKTQFQTNEASLPLIGSEAAVEEPPCIKKHIYQCGPSDKETLSTATTPNANDTHIVNNNSEDKNLAEIKDLTETEIKTTTIDVSKTKSPPPTTPTTKKDVDDDLAKHVTKNVELHEIRSSPHSPMNKSTSKSSTHPKHHRSPDREEHFIDERTILTNIESQIEFEDDTVNAQKIIDHIANKPDNQNVVKPKDSVDNKKPIIRETTFEKSDAKVQKPSKPVGPKATDSVPTEKVFRKSSSPLRQTESPVKRKPVHTDTQTPNQPTRPNVATHKEEDEILKQTITGSRQTQKNIKTTAHEFIQKESTKQEEPQEERPDGAFASKPTEPFFLNKTPERTSPTFRKKGLSRRETFEERCRQILGMEDAGDTQGTYKSVDQAEILDSDDEALKEDESPLHKKVPTEVESNDREIKPINELEPQKKQPTQKNDSLGKIVKDTEFTDFIVRVEDCEDDEVNYGTNIRRVPKEIKVEKSSKDTQEVNKTVLTTIEFETNDRPAKSTISPGKVAPKKLPDKETTTAVHQITADVRRPKARPNKETSPQRKPNESTTENKTKETLRKQTTKEVEIANKQKTETSVLKVPTTEKVTTLHTTKETKKTLPLKNQADKPIQKSTTPTIKNKKPEHPEDSDISIETETRKTTKTTYQICDSSVSDLSRTSSPERLRSPVRETNGMQPKEPTKGSPTPYNLRSNKPASLQQPLTKSPKPATQPTTRKPLSQKSPSKTTLKTKEDKTTTKQLTEEHKVVKKDLTDTRDSSPEVSPSRLTERRRSSNISVHTEIIIDHTPQSPTKKPEGTKPTKITKTDEVLLNRALIQKQNKKLTVTERKESAPVHRVTRKDTSKDVKMSRSTSENVIKSTPHANTKPERAPVGSRPNKCLTTKSINLTTMDRIINSEEMENVVIDIQHAKSSREPSPDKIVPTPVSTDIYTGKPRYPDVVQEPEDEPRRKPFVKNIPIFEEDTNDYVGCHIMEVKVNKTISSHDSSDNVEHEEILNSPTIEAPKSLDYPSFERPSTTTTSTDDVCNLSVHDKVTKFIHTAEEMKKPQSSKPFVKDTSTDSRTQVLSDDDECLLSVDEKVEKFLKTAEKVSNESYTTTREFDVSLKPTEKLAATTPQRSPELVAKIERQISRPLAEPEDAPENDTEPLQVSISIMQDENVSQEELASPRDKATIIRSTEKDTNEKRSAQFVTTKTQERYDLEITDDDSEPTYISDAPSQRAVLQQETEKVIYEDTPHEDSPVPLSKKPQQRSPQRETVAVSEVFITKEKLGNDYIADEIRGINDVSDDDKFTKSHTTNIELKRQKDILSRPSVFGDNKKTPIETQRECKNMPQGNYSTQPSSKQPQRETEKVPSYREFLREQQEKYTPSSPSKTPERGVPQPRIDASHDDYSPSPLSKKPQRRVTEPVTEKSLSDEEPNHYYTTGPLSEKPQVRVPQRDVENLSYDEHNTPKPQNNYSPTVLPKGPQRRTPQQETKQLSQVFITKEKQTSDYTKDEVREITEISDDDTLTKAHTTTIELKRQKDILSRPSVFGDKNKKPIQDTNAVRKPSAGSVRETEKQTATTQVKIKSSPIHRDKQHPITNGDKKPVTQNNCQHKPTAVDKNTNVFKTKTKLESTSSDVNVNQQYIGAEQWVSCDETTELKSQETTKKQQHTMKTSSYKTTSSPNKKPANERHSPSTQSSDLPLTSRSPVAHHSTKEVTTTKTTQRTVKHIPHTEQVDQPIEDLAHILDTTVERTPSKTLPKDSVAARRNLFEKGIPAKTTPKTKPIQTSPVKPSTATEVGRRPSYMDHTKCSLEHIRRDSLEINKTHYSRKSSFEDDTTFEQKPNSAVKFDIPKHSPREAKPTTMDDTDDLCIEEIFDLQVLEQMLETVTSYEIRRRIRAQIRLVKKNMQNLIATNVLTTTTKTSKPSEKQEPRERSKSPTYRKRSSVSPTTRHVSEGKPQEFVGEEVHLVTEIRTVTSEQHENDAVRKPIDRSRSPSEGKSPTNRRKSKPIALNDDKLNIHTQTNVKTTRHYETINQKSHDRTRSPTESSTPSTRRPQDQLDANKLGREVVGEHATTITTNTKETRKFSDIQDRNKTPRVQPTSATTKPTTQTKSPERSSSPSHATRKASTTSTSTTTTTTRKVSGTNSPERSPVRSTKTTTTTTTRSSAPTKEPVDAHQQKFTKTTEQTDNSTTQRKSTAVHTEQRTTTTKNAKMEQHSPDTGKSPVWANRKNILKNPSTSPRSPIRKPTSSDVNTRSKYTKITSTSSNTSSQQRNFEDTDIITSSYGIGPTDENGLPLFGIKALKKKSQTPAAQPSETRKVTGYVIEEKYYADNENPQPIVERKEMIYATDADDIEDIKNKLKNEPSLVGRQQQTDHRYITNEDNQTDCQEMLSSAVSLPTDSTKAQTSTTKYVRRGSVKEMSEKFIRKESSQSVTEKSSSSSYPKAGLILRTNSRTGATDEQDSYDMRRNEDIRKMFDDNDSYDDNRMAPSGEYRSEMSTRRTTYATEDGRGGAGGMDFDESESESVNIQRQVKSQKSTRSFLNSSNESKVITGIDDALERMRNADNVVEVGDTVEDQEARALLNKFLGASAIMSSVEAALPTTTTKQTKMTANIDRNNLNKQQIKTTRTTYTTKSDSSSSPVACKTCDIEEIWDEEFLKKLLEQATSYEERRKIRTRLRQLMAEREECKHSVSGVKAELSSSSVVAKDVETESSASEYETIIEEVTDYSDTDPEYDDAEAVDDKRENKAESQVFKTTEQKPELKVETKTEVIKSHTSSDKKPEDTQKIVTIQAVSGTPENKAESKAKKEETSQPKNDKSIDSTQLTGSAAQKTAKTTEQEHFTTTEKSETKDNDGTVVTTTTKVTTRTVSQAPKPVSPFAKFKQLDKQNSLQSTKSPPTPTTPGGSASGSAPLFKFTDPALNARAATVKDQLLQWCQSKTKEYENVQITNFSASWSDGLAFCALIHHFLPDAFDYSKLTPQSRKHNFELAFTVADEKAGIAPLLDVEDMVEMSRPDWKCVFIYVQSIYRRFRNCQ